MKTHKVAASMSNTRNNTGENMDDANTSKCYSTAAILARGRASHDAFRADIRRSVPTANALGGAETPSGYEGPRVGKIIEFE